MRGYLPATVAGGECTVNIARTGGWYIGMDISRYSDDSVVFLNGSRLGNPILKIKYTGLISWTRVSGVGQMNICSKMHSLEENKEVALFEMAILLKPADVQQ